LPKFCAVQLDPGNFLNIDDLIRLFSVGIVNSVGYLSEYSDEIPTDYGLEFTQGVEIIYICYTTFKNRYIMLYNHKTFSKNVINLFECYNFWELAQANLKVYDVVRTVLIEWLYICHVQSFKTVRIQWVDLLSDVIYDI